MQESAGLWEIGGTPTRAERALSAQINVVARRATARAPRRGTRPRSAAGGSTWPCARTLGRADLDLPAAPADGEIGQPGVLAVSRAGRDDRRVALALRELECLARVRERAGLVGLDEHRVCDAGLHAAREPLGRSREEVVPEQLHGVAEQVCREPPRVPVVLAQRILDRNQWVSRAQPATSRAIASPSSARSSRSSR